MQGEDLKTISNWDSGKTATSFGEVKGRLDLLNFYRDKSLP